jgi:AraC family transcriptional regulator
MRKRGTPAANMHQFQFDLKTSAQSKEQTCRPAVVALEERSTEGRSLAQLEMALAELFRAVSSALRDERDAAEQSIQRVAILLDIDATVADLPETPVMSESNTHHGRGGLAPWQIREVKIHIASNLGAGIRTQDLATIAGLSPFHFSRAFRDSFGDSPHSYLLRRRIERSQGLMLTTNATLADIALDCGLVDQAHFGKLFRRLVGESPGAWRRARASQAAQTGRKGVKAPATSTYAFDEDPAGEPTRVGLEAPATRAIALRTPAP